MADRSRLRCFATRWLLPIPPGTLLLLLALGCATTPSVPEPAADSRRQLAAGVVEGFVGRYGSHAWLGIPYAESPVGQQRWRAPRALAPWPGTLRALAHGSACSQYASAFGGIDGKAGKPVGDEDCLFLNVYAPQVAAEAVPRGVGAWPVMLWIHGGSNVTGHAGFYDGGNLAQREGVVVVTINYRLGPFGWFRHASLRNAGTSADDRSGNFGTLDMIRALEWVRDNIAAFGGDPGNVTIFGESAGGTDVLSLLQSPRAKGLFHRAIAQSGGLARATPAEAEHFVDDAEPGHESSSNEALLRLMIADGRAEDRAGAKAVLERLGSVEVARFLRTRSPAELLSVYFDEEDEGLTELPKVFAEGTVLPRGDALERLRSRRGRHPVPVLIGTNRDENKLFLFAKERHVRQWLGFLPRLRDPERYDALAEHMSAMWKATGADEPAAALLDSKAPGVFVYRFDWDEEPTRLGADLSRLVGAAHGLEIPFVFGHFELGRVGNVLFSEQNAPGREALSAQMMSYWAAFARSGAPGQGARGELPEWRPGPGFMLLDTPSDGGLRMSGESLTEESVLARIDSDARLRDERERCQVQREVVRWAHRHDHVHYANDTSAGGAGCAAFPFATYPWDD